MVNTNYLYRLPIIISNGYEEVYFIAVGVKLLQNSKPKPTGHGNTHNICFMTFCNGRVQMEEYKFALL